MRLRLPGMSRTDRARWRSARSIADLAELTALWLEGRIASHPGVMPNCGPDEETTHLVQVLALANRAGYLTDNSQPGIAEPGFDGRWWAQRAAVTGWVCRDRAGIDLANRIIGPAREAGLVVCADSHRHGVTVTSVDGRDYTTFGALLSKRDLRTLWPAHLIHRDLFRQLHSAIQLTVIDPEWGRDDVLWDVLAKALYTPSAPAAHPTITEPGLYVLVGAAGSGKSTLAARHFPAGSVLELDAFRALAAGTRADQSATPAAVTAFDAILTARLERGLPTVLDATHAEARHRRKYTDLAHQHGLPAIAVLPDTPDAECRRRNAMRPDARRVPPRILRDQARQAAHFNAKADGFDAVLRPADLTPTDPS
ncbi:AAA family ATPase [Streptomyces actinomycinicus]|uniref:AAA family ATPase n=1 Tax=Streptomyces actinomycinicus TaxID=1695166 RepID=A0A937EQY5_9ACTN|nr:AAA family ATPase [Streptomyces actinomycinicus]MBL1086805.1 AAA family ATPase [Streptomyces actinomycinicus]